MPKFSQSAIGLILVIIGINLIGLWAVQVLHFQGIKDLTSQSKLLMFEQSKRTADSSDSTPSLSPSEGQGEGADTRVEVVEQNLQGLSSEQTEQKSLLQTLQDAITLLTQRVAKVEETELDSSSTDIAGVGGVGVTGQTVTSTVNPVQESIVYIGSGSSTSLNWTNINSATVELNSYNYPNIKAVYFEATISIVGGEVFARVIDKDSGIVMTNSEVSHNNSTATLKVSPSTGLFSASSNYIVQLRSSSGEKAVLDGARLRIVWQ